MNYRIKILKLENLPPAQTVLSEPEYAKYRSFPSEKRRLEWLGGRTAAKMLFAEFFPRRNNMKDTVISYDESGRPIFSLKALKMDQSKLTASEEGLGRPVYAVTAQSCRIPALSISHSCGYAAAAVSDDSKFIGLDLEKIETRTPVWAKDYFHDSEIPPERGADGGGMLTRCWAKKEAVLKALGLGLKCSLLDVEITAKGPTFRGKAVEKWIELGKPAFRLNDEKAPEGYVLSFAAIN